MGKHLLQILALAACCPALFGLHIKVLSVDHKAGRITVLLPMHNAHVEAALIPSEPEIRVRSNQFYHAELEAGKVDTVKRNILRIDLPKQRPVRFRVRKITFLER